MLHIFRPNNRAVWLLMCWMLGAVAQAQAVRTGAEVLISDSIQLLRHKRVAVIANHTSRVRDKHLVDVLLENNIQLVRIFAPEHGFRGAADAGEHVANGRDTQTNLPIVSLYGNNKQPTAAQLADIDVVLFDIQDVGTRHYTYVSTMTLAMEACAAHHKPCWILDRPNPNGWYTDGPMMEAAHTSFIGMHTVPLVHGMTLGEYAQMANACWLRKPCALKVFWCEGYTHAMRWQQTGLSWVPPSPNLGTVEAAMWYPLLCWYEATPISVGRGTDSAFQLLGAPALQQLALPPSLVADTVCFRPRSIVGKAKQPPYLGETCRGLYLRELSDSTPPMLAAAQLLAAVYQAYPLHQPPFFAENFERWSGSRSLRTHIMAGKSPEDIYKSWQPAVQAFRQQRQPFLHYP